MNKKTLVAFTKQAAKSIKSEVDLTDFRKMFTKVTVQAALNTELDEHLGYSRHEQYYSSKTIRTEDGAVDLDAPRNRDASFEPLLIKKDQARFTSMENTIFYLPSKGMTTRDIVSTFKKKYGIDVSATLISGLTNAVIEQVIEW